MTEDSTKKEVRNIFQRKRVPFATVGKTMTIQSSKEETDVNAILKRYSKTGVLTHVNELKASYGDFSNVGSYQDAILAVKGAMEEFMDLPSKIRKEFNNDPQELVMFLQDPKNLKKAADLGLAVINEPSKPKPDGTPSPEKQAKEPEKAPAGA